VTERRHISREVAVQDGFLPDKSKYHDEAQRDMQAALGIVIGIALLIFCAMMVPKAVKVGFGLGTPGTYVVRDEPPETGEAG
jgi:hypothetical protein